MNLINLKEKFEEIRSLVAQSDFEDIKLTENFKQKYENLISNEGGTRYKYVEWAEYSAKIITTSDLIIYLPNYAFFISLKLSDYLEGLSVHNRVFREIFAGDNLAEKANSLKSGLKPQDENKITDYFEDKNYTSAEYDNFISYISDYNSWGGGKTIDRNDYYFSALLKVANLQAESHGAVADIASHFYKYPFLKSENIIEYKVRRNFEGVATKIMTRRSIGDFVFSVIKFLQEKDNLSPLLEKLVLRNSTHKHYNLEFGDLRLTTFFKESDSELEKIELFIGGKLRFFEKGFLIGDKYYYLSNQWTDNKDSRLDFQAFMGIFNKIYENLYKVESHDNGYMLLTLNKDVCNLNIYKPFLLLAGISGTGKTRFIRQQAQASGSLKENYCLVPVRPDWHEPSDLLGYISRLGTKGAEYVATDVTQFIAKAWRALFDAGLAFEKQENRLVLSGNGADLKNIKPYWLCLDEMNLAPVEQYFADYLSVLETREWVWDGDNFQYSSDPLLSPVTFEQLDNDNQEALRQTLGLESEDYNELWDHITEHGLGIPLNLIVAGTVNMDETTHGFSRKVIDRALSFDFGEFFPNEFAQFFEPQTQVKTLTFPIWSQASKAHLSSVQADADGAKTMTFLSDVNAILKGSPFELAYRALNELLLSVVAFSPNDEAKLQAVWDDFLMCKVLPRIEGDLDKLQGEEGILHKLERLLETSLGEIWIGTSRLDLYRKTINDGTELNVECRSKKKLAWMKERLASASFTSFWP